MSIGSLFQAATEECLKPRKAETVYYIAFNYSKMSKKHYLRRHIQQKKLFLSDAGPPPQRNHSRNAILSLTRNTNPKVLFNDLFSVAAFCDGTPFITF